MKTLTSEDIFKLESFQNLCRDLGVDTTDLLALTVTIELNSPCIYSATKLAKGQKEIHE